MSRAISRLLAASLSLGAATAAWSQEDPRDPAGRRILDGPPTVLGFKNVTVEQIIPFIVEATGKVVMPQSDVMSLRVTVLNDRPLPRAQALDLVLLALHQAGVAVVENGDVITLRALAEIDRQDVPVIPASQSVLRRNDLGTIAEKIFALRNSTAKNVGEILEDAVPDYAKLTVDIESNQIAVMGNIALLRRIEALVTELDRPGTGVLVSETFQLRYADAAQIEENIRELYDVGSAQTQNRAGNQQGGRGGNQQNNRGEQLQRFFGGQQQGGGEQGAAASTQTMRVTSNVQQNSVTVLAEQAIVDQVRTQIRDHWDQPLEPDNVIPRIYDLQNSDPIKVRDLLVGLFGQATTGGGGGGGGGGQNRTSASQGAGRLAGQFSFEAMPESGRLAVVAKSPDHLAAIDAIISELDRPQTVGLPSIVELKHASAEELAEQLNTLLAQDGTLAQIRRSESGLSEGTASVSPFAQEAAAGAQSTQEEAVAPDVIQFWWQRSRPPTDAAGASNLIGKIRLVPVWRQNALMVLAPPEYKASVVALIAELDRPGRQVLIRGIVAEVSRDDALAWGLRWSSSGITPTNIDNSIAATANFAGSQDNLIGDLFNTSVLDVGINLNALLQALSEKTAVTILSEPKIFTSDNQEAEFFDGQDIPFITESQPNNQGNLVQSFDYRAVGIQLRARPRITPNKDVDLRVNLELSSIVPGQTLFGGFVVDRRETTTQLIVRHGQTVVISGILRREKSDIVRGLPILMDIPILGELFKSREEGETASELVVFITPFVVENTEGLDKLNEEFRKHLGAVREEVAPGEGEDGANPGAGDGDQSL